MAEITTVNPATGEDLQTYEVMGRDEVMGILAAAQRAWLGWRDVPADRRSRRLTDLAAVLRREKGRYGRLMTLEMGKPLGEAVAEVEKCAWLCDHYAEHAPQCS